MVEAAVLVEAARDTEARKCDPIKKPRGKEWDEEAAGEQVRAFKHLVVRGWGW